MKERSVKIEIVVAVDARMGIGFAGDLPWAKSKSDMKNFVAITTGKAIVMGRATADSIPPKFFPLKDRVNIVLTRNRAREYPPGVRVVHDIDSAIDVAEELGIDLCVIGGEDVYEAFLPMADTVHLSKTEQEYVCDRHFPRLQTDGWGLEAERVLDDQWTYQRLARVRRSESGDYIPARSEPELYRTTLTVYSKWDPRKHPMTVAQWPCNPAIVAMDTVGVEVDRVYEKHNEPLWPQGAEVGDPKGGHAALLSRIEVLGPEGLRVNEALSVPGAWKKLFRPETEWTGSKRAVLWKRSRTLGLDTYTLSLTVINDAEGAGECAVLDWSVWRRNSPASYILMERRELEGALSAEGVYRFDKLGVQIEVAYRMELEEME